MIAANVTNITNVHTVDEFLRCARAILNMDDCAARRQWGRKWLECEADFVCYRRRREQLAKAGKDGRFAMYEWADLPRSVRDALGAVA